MAKVQVILTETVAGQGKKGEIVSVSEGYAKNFIVKNKKGIIATAEELKKLEAKKVRDAKKDQEQKAKALELAEKLQAKSLIMRVKTGKNGKIFGSITHKELETAIEKDFGIKVDKKKIDGTIKKLGEHHLNIKLHKGVKAKLKVLVEEKA